MKSPLSGADCVLIKHVEVASLRDRWQEAMQISWDPPIGIQQISYWKDPLTGFSFYTPSELAGPASLYEQLQKFDWYYMPEKWEFRQALSWIQAEHGVQRLLEVGVGRGFFLQHARRAGLEPVGVELNPQAAELARSHGFEVMTDPLDVLRDRLGDSQCDVICSFQVLEHLSDPISFLRDATALLRSNGVLILSVPNADVARALDPQRDLDLLDQPPHHMGHWSSEVFRYLPTVLPLQLEALAYEPLAPQHVEWFVAAWCRQWRACVPKAMGRLLMNRYSQALLRGVLHLGFRRFVRGHTLMVRYRKPSVE